MSAAFEALRMLPPLEWWLLGLSITAVAFLLRVGVHVGRDPGGVDTWYYLAYADAVRRAPGLDVRLPQYLLQDERQSYPPLFPTLLAGLPSWVLRRWFWAISPLVDCAHLWLLYFVTYRLTSSLAVGGVAALAYACTPHLISESRSLSARPFGALLHSVALICMLKYTLSPIASPRWLVFAVASGAALFLSSAAMAAAYGVVSTTLSLGFADPRYLAIACGALVAAIALSGGHYLRVIRNYVYAVEYWRRHKGTYGAHPVRDSPVYGSGAARAVPVRPGFLGGNTAQQLLRLVGENPFLLALPFAPRGFMPWGPRLWLWAACLGALSVVATVLPPLRAFGPGRSYMKAGVFPTAYTLAFGIGTLGGLVANPVGIVTLACLGFSMGAIWFFYAYVRARETEQTATTPPALAAAVAALRQLPTGGVFVLPYMYADYVCYHSGRPVLWGGHCGDLGRFELITPVIARPLPELFRENGVRYVLLDSLYVSKDELELAANAEHVGEYASFHLYAIGGEAIRAATA